jgi:perosamine synthetase
VSGEPPIPITKPVFGEEELRAVQLPIESGWVLQGPHVRSFEQRFSAYTGARHSVATSSGTSALQVAVAALGLGRGDEVIVPGFTWVSTANVVEFLGASPIFCDIDLDTYNIDPTAAAAAVTERTVGIIPVHLFGLPAEMDTVLALARRHNLWVVEDAACSLGGWYRGQHTGRFGDAGCFSFHPRKSITTGEGGMITTDRNDLAALASSLRDHGASRSVTDRHDEGTFLLSEHRHLGFNFRLTDIQGALGCAQMDRLNAILDGRRRVAALYDELLEGVDWLKRPTVPGGCTHGFQAYVCLFCPEEPTLANVDALHKRRNDLMVRLDRLGIATRQGTHAAAIQAFYTDRYGVSPEDVPRSFIADRLTIALPLYPELTASDQNRVVSSLKQAIAA